jgi:nitronate monooxygenase
VQKCRSRGICTVGTATSLPEALALQEIGVDAVVAQGVEAGGHRGIFSARAEDPAIGTLALVRLMTARLNIPVIAAGGIMDGRGIAAAAALGADAAQLGTAFLACKESGISGAYRAALLNPEPKATRITRSFSGRLARGLENRLMHEMEGKPLLPFPAQNSLTQDIRRKAAELNRREFLSMWAGQAVDLIRPATAGDLVKELLAEYRKAKE